MRKFIIPVLAVGTMFAAAPASAAHNRGGNQIGQEISRLSMQISRAEQRGVVSHREAKGLRRQAINVQRNFRNFSRNGVNQREYAVLRSQLQQIRYNLRVERRDADRRRG